MNNSIFSIGEIVNIERHENKGNSNRIPQNCRSYINKTNYMYKGIIINLCINKPYFRVRQLPINCDISNDILDKYPTRKANKKKTYKLEL